MQTIENVYLIPIVCIAVLFLKCISFLRIFYSGFLDIYLFANIYIFKLCDLTPAFKFYYIWDDLQMPMSELIQSY